MPRPYPATPRVAHNPEAMPRPVSGDAPRRPQPRGHASPEHASPGPGGASTNECGRGAGWTSSHFRRSGNAGPRPPGKGQEDPTEISGLNLLSLSSRWAVVPRMCAWSSAHLQYAGSVQPEESE